MSRRRYRVELTVSSIFFCSSYWLQSKILRDKMGSDENARNLRSHDRNLRSLSIREGLQIFARSNDINMWECTLYASIIETNVSSFTSQF